MNKFYLTKYNNEYEIMNTNILKQYDINKVNIIKELNKNDDINYYINWTFKVNSLIKSLYLKQLKLKKEKELNDYENRIFKYFSKSIKDLDKGRLKLLLEKDISFKGSDKYPYSLSKYYQYINYGIENDLYFPISHFKLIEKYLIKIWDNDLNKWI